MIKLNTICTIKDNIIRIYKFVVIYNVYTKDYGKEISKDYTEFSSKFITRDDADNYVIDYLNKHMIYEYVKTEAIDTSEYEWIDGIEIPEEFKSNAYEYINKLLEEGEEMYKLFIQNSIENYLINNDYRITAIELGLN